METKFDASHLDVRAFARAQGQAQGRSALEDWMRLREESAQAGLKSLQVQWQMQGRLQPRTGAEDEVWVHVQAHAEVQMQCQRCLTPVVVPLSVDRDILFVADEATAAELDDTLDDDVLVLSKDFDALALVEDELIMELPLVPRHEVCPQALPAQSTGEEDLPQRVHPFAALAALKAGQDKK
jgi:uncharacterized protein